MIEAMCVACHGPIQRRRHPATDTRRPVTAIVCGENCHGYWHHHLKKGHAESNAPGESALCLELETAPGKASR